MSGEVDEETAEKVQEDLADASEDVSDRQQWFANIQLALFFFTVFAIIILAVKFGYLDSEITILAEANVGWVFEYSFALFFVAFWLYIAKLFIESMEASVLNGIGALAFGIADYMGRIEEEEE